MVGGGLLPTMSPVHPEEDGLLIPVREPLPDEGPQPVGPPDLIPVLVPFPGVAYAWHMLEALTCSSVIGGAGYRRVHLMPSLAQASRHNRSMAMARWYWC